jgi:hypothetical protein
LRNLRRRVHTLLAAALLFGLLGCSVQAPLRTMDESHPIKTGSLAVISGSHRGGDAMLAELVTRQLENSDRFRVLPQQEIARRVPDYPVLIEMQDSSQISENDEKAIWFSPAGKARLDAIQAQLGVDYVLVLWIPKITRETPISLHGGQFFHVYPVGNLLEYPAGRVVGSSRLHTGETIVWITTRNKPSGERIENLIEEAADKIAASLNDMSVKAR